MDIFLNLLRVERGNLKNAHRLVLACCAVRAPRINRMIQKAAKSLNNSTYLINEQLSSLDYIILEG